VSIVFWQGYTKKDELSLHKLGTLVEKGNMFTLRHSIFAVFSMCLLLLLAACAPSVATQTDTQQQVTINKTFQSAGSPIPTVPPYRCGAWSSNNAPGASSTITIYARLTKNIAPVSGANATAVVHFRSGDQTIDAQTPSDNGGYVSFIVQLQGQQPGGVPATVDVTFTNIPGGPGSLSCTPAFFTVNS
jgi:hypothetical protein